MSGCDSTNTAGQRWQDEPEQIEMPIAYLPVDGAQKCAGVCPMWAGVRYVPIRAGPPRCPTSPVTRVGVAGFGFRPDRALLSGLTFCDRSGAMGINRFRGVQTYD